MTKLTAKELNAIKEAIRGANEVIYALCDPVDLIGSDDKIEAKIVDLSSAINELIVDIYHRLKEERAK